MKAKSAKAAPRRGSKLAPAVPKARLPRLPPLPRLPRLPFPLFRLQRVNLPNQLTLLRIVLIAPFILLFLSDDYRYQWASLVVFFASALTDYYDGKIARERNLITNFGKIMDPLADKLLMLTAMISLVQVGVVPGWMVTVIWWRELAVTGLRTLVAARRRVLAADRWGKLKTVLQITASVAGMLSYVIQNTLNARSAGWQWRLQNADWGGDPIAQIVDTYAIAYWLMVLAAIVSLVSGLNYFRNNWEIVCQELEQAERVES
jgi:CDP-diacylglycerol--glycerol-3-phosphate 3-phosphatidyltransferase